MLPRPTVLLLLILGASLVLGEVQESTIESPWGFIGRFCYDKASVVDGQYQEVGSIEVEVTFPTATGPPLDLSVYEFHDGTDSWRPISNPNTPCLERVNGHYRADPTQLVQGTGDKRNVYYMRRRVVGSNRDRFFFYGITSSDLSCGNIPKYNVRVHFTRDDIAWNEELGVNTVGLNTLYVCMIVFYIILLTIHLYSVRKLSATLKYVHPVIRFFTFVMCGVFLAVLLKVLHYAQLASNGVGFPIVDRFATGIDGIARIAFVVLLLLLAKGWTISTTILEGKMAVLGLSLLFTILYVTNIAVYYTSINPQEISPSDGIIVFNNIVVAVGLLFALWFCFLAYGTYKIENNPIKKRFLLLLCMFYGLYLLSVPFVAFLSFVLDPWVKDKVTEGFTACATFFGLFILTVLFWHSRAEKYFIFDNPVEITADADFSRL